MMSLEKIVLTKSGIKGAGLRMLEEVAKRSECQMVKYANLVAIKRAAESAIAAIQDAAITEAVGECAADAAEFQHEGLFFQLKRAKTYDFSQSNSWLIKREQLRRAEELVKLRKTELKSIEQNYIEKVKPTPSGISLSLAFTPED